MQRRATGKRIAHAILRESRVRETSRCVQRNDLREVLRKLEHWKRQIARSAISVCRLKQRSKR